MTILQCKMCNKPFQSLGGKICNNCLESMEEDYKKVREYIHEHDRADLEEVAEETGVSKNVILHFLKDGRLEIGDPGGTGGVGGGVLFCEVCKKPISSGRMCNDCKRSLATRIQGSLGGGDTAPQRKERPMYSEKSNAKMHIDHKK